MRWRTFGPIVKPSSTKQTSGFYLGLRKIIYIVCSVDRIYISVGSGSAECNIEKPSIGGTCKPSGVVATGGSVAGFGLPGKHVL